MSNLNIYHKLLSQTRIDFDRLRTQTRSIKMQIIHKASNANAEGVKGMPRLIRKPLAFQGAGRRDFEQNVDTRGFPTFRDDPVLDAMGHPIVNSVGQAFNVRMPASRSVMFEGEIDGVNRFLAIGERAGGTALGLSHLPALHFTKEWKFNSASELWWALLFETAWNQRHPLLKADKQLWLPSDQPSAFIPYDLESVQLIASEFTELNAPINWLKRLPEAWTSTLDDATSSSMDLVDLLLSELDDTSARTTGDKNEPQSDKTMNEPLKLKRRFTIALSFSGKRRTFVQQVAKQLKQVFGEEQILYDKFHETEFARRDLDIILPRLYEEEADLIVVFICGAYRDSEWCGLEWRSIRQLLKSRLHDKNVMFLRFDNEPLDGQLSIDGHIDISNRSVRKVADSILRRWVSIVRT